MPLTVHLPRALVALAGLALLAAAECEKYGFSNRILHRVASPDGRFVAVCQEVPVFDGPEFTVRLEDSDGVAVRELLYMGDAGGCAEVVWSGDGRMLAVLTSHVATIHIIDVAWAAAHSAEQNRHWFARQFSFSSDRAVRRAGSLTFVSPSEIEFLVCDYSIEHVRRTGDREACLHPPRRQRLVIPSPLVRGPEGEEPA